LAAATAALLALVAVGILLLVSASAADRRALDAGLVSRVEQAQAVGRRALERASARPARRASRQVGRLLGPVTGGADVAVIRVVRAGTVLDRLGATADPGLPTRAPASPATVSTPAGRWRIVQRPIRAGLVVQAATPTAVIDARRDDLAVRIALAGVAAALITGALAFALAGPALAALGRLRRDAAGLARTADLRARMPEDRGPDEVRELAVTLNAMLARLQGADADRRTALDATRAFAADAGHELRTPLTATATTIEALRTHPELPETERQAMLAEVAEEHDRLIALLDALQSLARGDAGARLERERVDLAELAEQAVAAARARDPRAAVTLEAPERATVEGWAPGLRSVLDNLLVNALVHGRAGAAVAVAIRATDGTIELEVDDDGPGIPAADRDAVLGRFSRGRATRAPGSGLGLALVDQQVRLHGGTLVLGDAPAGGLRVRVTLPAAPT
jgi:two-component system sensor histidine kinase PrrB